MRATASFASAIAASSTASPELHDTSGLQAAAALAVSERSKCTIASTATGALGREIENTSMSWCGPSVHGVHASPAAPLARSWPSIRPASPTARNSPETMPGGNRSFARRPSAPSELDFDARDITFARQRPTPRFLPTSVPRARCPLATGRACRPAARRPSHPAQARQSTLPQDRCRETSSAPPARRPIAAKMFLAQPPARLPAGAAQAGVFRAFSYAYGNMATL